MATHDEIIKELLSRPGVAAEVERIEREESELLDALRPKSLLDPSKKVFGLHHPVFNSDPTQAPTP